MAKVIFDIGGTKSRVAKIIGEGEFSEPLSAPTPKDANEGVQQLIDLARQVAAGEEIESVAGGIAGILEGDIIVNSSNLKGWIGTNLKERVQSELGANLILENDSAVVGLGEAVYGAGQDKKIVVYVTVSTGVGGARIVGGKIDEKSYGFEPGHQIINIDSGESLEKLVSGRSFTERFGVKPYEVTDPAVWEKAAKDLAVGLHNIILHWSPDVVVLGGPMMVGDPAISISEVEAHLSQVMRIFKKLPEVRLATLKDFGGLYGAMVLSK